MGRGYLPIMHRRRASSRPAAVASLLPVLPLDGQTDDHFFLGVPGDWNVVAFYAVVLTLGTS